MATMSSSRQWGPFVLVASMMISGCNGCGGGKGTKDAAPTDGPKTDASAVSDATTSDVRDATASDASDARTISDASDAATSDASDATISDVGATCVDAGRADAGSACFGALALFNTGVDATGVALAGGSVDPHYKLILSADTTF